MYVHVNRGALRIRNIDPRPPKKVCDLQELWRRRESNPRKVPAEFGSYASSRNLSSSVRSPSRIGGRDAQTAGTIVGERRLAGRRERADVDLGVAHALADDLRGAQPRDLAYRIAGSLAVDAPQQQALLELETTSARLAEETRILNRETELLRDLLVRLRERGERPELN